MIRMRYLTGAVLVLLFLAAPGTRADDIDRKAVERAHKFLEGAARGRDVLSYVHFGSRYDGHVYRETRVVNRAGTRVAGHFALVYAYSWEGDGKSNVAFLCDARGQVYDVQVVSTNAVLNQPFLTANATIKVLGNLLIAALEKNLTEKERKEIQQFVDSADARGMLVWSCKFQQALGR